MDKPTQLKLSLCLPIQERVASGQHRVMGDPGAAEQFELPKYAYLIIMKQTGPDAWEVWRKEELTLAEEDWTRTRYYGLNETRGDSIYKYNGDLQFLLRNETLSGRAYAICSNKKLNFNTSMASIDDMNDLMDWKFDTAPDSIQENLQNIYSTPYNYIREGRYYCSFDCSAGNVYNLDLLLYHVASKVDITWYVADSMRINSADPSQAVRLTYMEARRLFNGYAYCFKPMRNTLPALPASGGYDRPNIVTPSDEGLWWEGRSYFYTIPYTIEGNENYFPLQMLMRTNDSEGTGYQPTIRLLVDTDSPFVPWLRANFNLNNPLVDGTADKTANE